MKREKREIEKTENRQKRERNIYMPREIKLIESERETQRINRLRYEIDIEGKD